MFFLNCDGSMGLNPANSRLAFGAKVPHLQDIVSAASGWIEQFQNERFAANSMTLYISQKNFFAQNFQPWTPHPYLQWTTFATTLFP